MKPTLILVPARPIRRVLEEAIEMAEVAEQERRATRFRFGEGTPTGAGIVARRIAEFSRTPGGGQPRDASTVNRAIHRIRFGDTYHGKKQPVKHITFELADVILCALDRQFDWYTNRQLARVYAKIARGTTCASVTNGTRRNASKVEPAPAELATSESR